MWETIKQTLAKHLVNIILIVVLIITVIIFSKSCQSQNQENQILQNNITALLDSITYYEDKSNNIVAQKTILLGEVKDLKNINASLYKELSDMKSKNADLVAKINGLISMPKRDTIFIYDKDSINIENEIKQEFYFSDEYRLLTGNIILKENTIGLNIDTDEVYFDYTIAIEDEILKIKSNNPYVKYNDIISIKKPKEKPKRWNVGVQVGLGFSYDLLHQNFGIGPYIGAGISYGFSF